MKTDELRERYLAFFESKGCVRRPSDVLVPKDDPTVLFTPAGMNQFKQQFLGIGKLEFTRATTCQKCLRTGDISNVGVTAYHHTFFEMLGNFSFGDYFKREAIHWAWEFLTAKQWLALDKDRLTVTVYLDDDEAHGIWHKEVGLAADRISREDEGENFWPANAPSQGPDGVCGPCSEIYFHPPGGSKPVEIWNLVFTQFNRVGNPPNNLRPLPSKNIDTGMGLERTASVMQGKTSNFEIDTLRPLCEAAGAAVGRKYAFDAAEGRALRRIADHVRAVSFAVHEGCVPSNEKAGYIVRLLLRRAFLEGYLLGVRDPFLHSLVPAVVQAMRVPYPELTQTVNSVAGTIRAEEEHFLGTIDRGLTKFDRISEQARSTPGKTISGRDAFDLHQTDGFVFDLTMALAADRGLHVDVAGFKVAQQEHQAKSGQGSWGVMAAGPLDAIRQQHGDTGFLAYESTTVADAKVVGLLRGGEPVEAVAEPGALVDVVLDRTPFYGEAGGQVGDVGTLETAAGKVVVEDAQRHTGLIVHRGRLESGTIRTGETVRAVVDVDRRAGIRRAHSATHLLHHALRKELGADATQRGSKVEDDQLRFDFAWGKALTEEQLRTIEDEVNARIAEGAAVSVELMPIKEALKTGAMALFGEKYPDKVRVVRMGDFSTELCGGTHLSNTGQAGVCRVVRDEAIAAGIRRVTALTGRRALERIRETERLLHETAALVKVQHPQEIPDRIKSLNEELRTARQELAKFHKGAVAQQADDLFAKAETLGETRLVVHVAEGVGREGLRDFVDPLRKDRGSVAILLGTVVDGNVALLAAVSQDLIARGVKAGECVKVAAQVVGGGGGGRPDMAEAGGKQPEKLAEALAAAAQHVRAKLGK